LRSFKDSVHEYNFYSDEEVIYAVNDGFKRQDKKFFINGVILLARGWEKCVAILGDFTEKW